MIPRTNSAIKEYVISSAFILIGLLIPNGVLVKGFTAHISGIAVGMGISWFIKTILDLNVIHKEFLNSVQIKGEAE